MLGFSPVTCRLAAAATAALLMLATSALPASPLPPLQAIANTYGVRVTFLSGDVHVGGFGCFQAHPKQHLRVVDPKFMMQVNSSHWVTGACCNSDRLMPG